MIVICSLVFLTSSRGFLLSVGEVPGYAVFTSCKSTPDLSGHLLDHAEMEEMDVV